MNNKIPRYKKGYKQSKKEKKERSKRLKAEWRLGIKKGHGFSKEARTKISNAHRGQKSYNWKGGITKENKKIRQNIEFRLWRESVFARDNWTCQKCKTKGGILHPHHIKNFSQYIELRFAIDNGITLCKNCHIKFHKKFGKNNNTKEQLELL